MVMPLDLETDTWSGSGIIGAYPEDNTRAAAEIGAEPCQIGSMILISNNFCQRAGARRGYGKDDRPVCGSPGARDAAGAPLRRRVSGFVDALNVPDA